MDNPKILTLLEKQRDHLFERLKKVTIAGLYEQEYQDIKAGRTVVLDYGEKKMLDDLKELAKNTSLDRSFEAKLGAYLALDNHALIIYFQKELDKMINEIISSRALDDIQALFIEYDHYYHFSSCVTGYGIQEYPEIHEPRYISGEYDYNKQVLFLERGIDFEPAWLDCQEFEDLDYLDINFELQRLFQFHSRVLLHKALANLSVAGKLDLFKNRPFSFFINEHDCEVMLLYKIS
ncbi:MAG: hypothetical protein REI78_10430 [Pedobacter sp.]|nr:hypothetical protein [Pedobacter sp.]